MELLDWIDITKLHLYGLSKNPNAIDFLEQNPDKLNWGSISYNSNKNKKAFAFLFHNNKKRTFFLGMQFIY